jgi:hypothetical protein
MWIYTERLEKYHEPRRAFFDVLLNQSVAIPGRIPPWRDPRGVRGLVTLGMMESKIAKEARSALIADAKRMTPEQRLNAFLPTANS